MSHASPTLNEASFPALVAVKCPVRGLQHQARDSRRPYLSLIDETCGCCKSSEVSPTSGQDSGVPVAIVTLIRFLDQMLLQTISETRSSRQLVATESVGSGNRNFASSHRVGNHRLHL